jgi:predicted nucleic acid-binding protein
MRRMLEAGEDLGVCPVTITEFYAGLEPALHSGWTQFFAELTFWPISRDAWVQAGIWRHAFARQGAQLATVDTLVAAVAQEVGAVIVTSNARDNPMGVALLDPGHWGDAAWTSKGCRTGTRWPSCSPGWTRFACWGDVTAGRSAGRWPQQSDYPASLR